MVVDLAVGDYVLLNSGFGDGANSAGVVERCTKTTYIVVDIHGYRNKFRRSDWFQIPTGMHIPRIVCKATRENYDSFVSKKQKEEEESRQYRIKVTLLKERCSQLSQLFTKHTAHVTWHNKLTNPSLSIELSSVDEELIEKLAEFLNNL